MDLFDIRKDFSLRSLDVDNLETNPMEMLNKWVEEAITIKALEPTAMCLSTVARNGQPSSRIVLLKEIKPEGLIFFTNYESKKGIEIKENNKTAVNFCWHELERQIRVEGETFIINTEESDKYYNMRPENSKIGAWASPQSRVIPNRKYLESLLDHYKEYFDNTPPSRPSNWGGYIIKPNLIEFWQGRQNRLHDRFQYTVQQDNSWKIERLAP